MRLGTGPRARLRFDVERAREALTATSVRDDASGDKSRTTRRAVGALDARLFRQGWP